MENIVDLLIQYKYVILFPLAIVEGPILAIIGGFLCTSGFLNPYIIYPLILTGDMIGDSLVYILGRWGVPGFLKRIARRFGLATPNIEPIRTYFNSNPKKTISLSKITLGIGFAGLYVAGNARIPYNKFIGICLITSALQYVVYMSIGLLFGAAYKQISHYLDFVSALIFVLALAIILVYFVKSRRKKI
jgi:membrane protein DedA with SNARE-associated domain